MTDQQWPQSFEEILRRHLPFAPDNPFAPQDRLADLGLDSLGTVSMLLDLEDNFEVAVPDELLVGETFESVGSLWSVIDGLTVG